MGAPLSHALTQGPLVTRTVQQLLAVLQPAVRSHAGLYIVGWEWVLLVVHRSLSGLGMESRSDQVVGRARDCPLMLMFSK